MILNLFEEPAIPEKNLLPKGGKVNYYGTIFEIENADFYYDYLLHQIPWKNDEAMIFGKLVLTKRKVAWFGDLPFEYTYSKRTKLAEKWTKELLQLKQKAEELTNETYNSCLLNLYHDGSEGMAYHSDGEKDLKKNGAIASLSFGAERKFSFKHKMTKEKVEINLQHGSLLVMKDETQTNWLHRLPPTRKISQPRINLTFRTIVTHNVDKVNV